MLTQIYGVTRPQWVNSLRPGDAYMHLWTASSLVQVMACRLFSAKPLPEPMQTVSWILRNKLQQNFNQNSYIFIEENVFESVVYKTSAILSQPEWVNQLHSKLECFYSKKLIYNCLTILSFGQWVCPLWHQRNNLFLAHSHWYIILSPLFMGLTEVYYTNT